MNFGDVNVISLSPAYEYVLQRVAAEFEIVEINVPENIQGIFDIVIPFHNLNTVAVKQELSEIENWQDMKYKFSDFTAEGKRREVNKISQELRAKQEELVQVNYALDAQKLGFYDPEYVSKNYGDFKDKLNLIRKKQKELVFDNQATVINKNKEIRGHSLTGNIFYSSIVKLMIRNFNIESEMIISNVNYLNRLNSIKRLEKSFDYINGLHRVFNIALSKKYLDLKIQELNLVSDFKLKASEVDDNFTGDEVYHNLTLELIDGKSFKFLIRGLTKDEWYQCKNRRLDDGIAIERYVCEKCLLNFDKKHLPKNIFDLLPVETIEEIFNLICNFSGIWP